MAQRDEVTERAIQALTASMSGADDIAVHVNTTRSASNGALGIAVTGPGQ